MDVKETKPFVMGKYPSLAYIPMQFTVESVAPEADGEIYSVTAPTQGIFLMCRTICDSERLEVILSSSKDTSDIRRRVVSFETEKKDHLEDCFNNFLGYFYNIAPGEKLYFQANNKGSVETGQIVVYLVFGA